MAQKIHAHRELPTDIDPLLDRKQVQTALSVCSSSVYNLVRRGKLAPQRQVQGTNRVGWRMSDVQRYLNGLPPVTPRPLPGDAA